MLAGTCYRCKRFPEVWKLNTGRFCARKIKKSFCLGLLQPYTTSVGVGPTRYPGTFGNKKRGIASRNIETPNDVLVRPPASTELSVFIITGLQRGFSSRISHRLVFTLIAAGVAATCWSLTRACAAVTFTTPEWKSRASPGRAEQGVKNQATWVRLFSGFSKQSARDTSGNYLTADCT